MVMAEIDDIESFETDDPMMPVCLTCENYTGGRMCKAFPGGIPPSIWFGADDHTEPFTGDGGIQYREGLPAGFGEK